LLGGVLDQFSQRMDDPWSFDPSRGAGRGSVPRTPPPARGGWVLMAYDPDLERFFVGGRHSPERFLEEVWSLSLDERAAGRARYAFDRAGFGAAKEWFSEGDAPGDSRLEFRFRGSADGLDFGAWSASAPATDRYVEVEVTLRPGSQGERPVLHRMGFR
jgi:hypothetical protein